MLSFMNHDFTAEIQAWLERPDEEKDYDKGAVYFLQLSNNKIMYRTFATNPKKYAKHIVYQIRKYFSFRIQQLTHEQVEEMERRVALIVAEHGLDREKSAAASIAAISAAAVSAAAVSADAVSVDGIPAESAAAHEGLSPDGASKEAVSGEEVSREEAASGDSSSQEAASGEAASPQGAAPKESPSAEFRRGKRADHDRLPPEIQAKYQENLSLLQQMRELHVQLRRLSTEDSTCPDSERYPFLKELIEKDKRLHRNWEEYDRFVLVDDNGVKHDNVATDEGDVLREQALNALKWVNLAKGRYKKSPSEELKAQIVEKYRMIASPSEKLTDELKSLGVLENETV